MEAFNLQKINILRGFFYNRQKINGEITIPCVYKRFLQSGRFDALKCKVSKKGSHIYWDSDVAKWLEGACYYLSKHNDDNLRFWYNTAVNDIVTNQLDNGYFNSYFQVYDKNNIYSDRLNHELYCAGHLFETAVASSKYLDDNRLLNFSKKYVDYIYDRFVVKKDTAFVTPGHEEIELALLRLYEYTKENKYKQLAEFFIFNRGLKEEQPNELYDRQHFQSQDIAYNQHTAHGHAVRAMYFYTAMAKLAKINNDDKLKIAVTDIVDDLINSKMYITGGVGSSHSGENITTNYDLPNFTAYCETCASIGFVFLLDAMIKLTGKAIYSDVLERVLYNSLLSGISLKGDKFFYVNPLEMQLNRAKFYLDKSGVKEKVPLYQRVKLFNVSCCPPNLCRFFAQMEKFIYYQYEDKSSLVISQFIDSEINSEFVKGYIHTNMPYYGKITICLDSFGKKIKLKVRKPSWCEKMFSNEKDGFLVFDQVFDNKEITIDFPISLQMNFGNLNVYETAGKVALNYGPMILCGESADNDFPFFGCRIKDIKYAKVKVNEKSPFVVKVKVPVMYSNINNVLYSKDCHDIKGKLILVPYFAWANRKEGDMKVWFCRG